jgi:DNA invertase Pin-like site-specific DNA recombinase
MGDIFGYTRLSDGDQDLTGQTTRLNQTGAMRLFSDGGSGRSVDRPGLEALLWS